MTPHEGNDPGRDAREAAALRRAQWKQTRFLIGVILALVGALAVLAGGRWFGGA